MELWGVVGLGLPGSYTVREKADGDILATLRVFGDCTATAEYLIVGMRGDYEYAHIGNLHGIRSVS
jgi:hypothetical protein